MRKYGDPMGCITGQAIDPWAPYRQPPETASAPSTPVPSIQEQMGVDPVSKLAAAIEKLADAIKEGHK